MGVVVYIRHALTPEPASQPLRISDGAVGVVAMGTDHGWDGGGAQLELMHVHGGHLGGGHQHRAGRVEHRRLLVHPRERRRKTDGMREKGPDSRPK